MRPVILFAALTASACPPPAQQATKTVHRAIAWRRLGSWSGQEKRQTESFRSDSGVLRVCWSATDPARHSSSSSLVAAFRLTAHSAISGRSLQQVVNHVGAGRGVNYVQQVPNTFYMIVESSHVNWTFTIDEAIGYR